MLVESNMKELGSDAIDFKLPDTVSGKDVGLQEVKGDIATVIMFICNHCPYVQHVNSQLVSIASDYQEKGVSFVAISANDVADYPEDSPENMKLYAEKLGYPFPYLYDESQETAKAYGATCTPDFFAYDKELKLAYRGRLDDANPANDAPNDGHAIRAALDNMIAGKLVSPEQIPSMGCSIKWKH